MNPQTGDIKEFSDAKTALLLGYTEPLTKGEYELMRMTATDQRAVALYEDRLRADKHRAWQESQPKGSTFMPSPKSRFKQRRSKSGR